MNVVSEASKAILCAVLLVAGGAKLADLSGFASTVRLFVPRYRWMLRRAPRIVAVGVAVAELVVGIMSLSLPHLRWPNVLVLCVAGAFVVVSTYGYAVHRNRSCRCFGALSQRRFDLGAVARSIVISTLAAVVVARPAAIPLAAADEALLGLSAALLAFAAFTAARSLNVVRGAYPDLGLR